MTDANIDQAFQIAVQHHRSGRLAEAEAIYRQILAQHPNRVEALHLLGMLAAQQGRLDSAIELLRQAIRLKPGFAEAYDMLANALKAAGKLDEALAAYRRAIELKPDLAESHSNLGNVLLELRQFDEAITSYQQAIRLKPNHTGVYCNLGTALYANEQTDDAIAAFRHAVQLKPDFALAHNNLGNALKDIGQLDEAIAAYRQAIRLKPDFMFAHSNLLYALHYHPGYDAKTIYEEHRRWNHQFAEPARKFIRPHTNNRDPDRRLRIGYVSPDFRECPIGPTLLPLLREHDHQQMEIFCYSHVLRPDARTDQLRSHADVWRNLVGLPDSQALSLIQQDGLDILVDLALHTGNRHLMIFAHKPAPVQVAWLAYPGTTGMPAIDYRLSDPYLDPPDSDLSLYSERTIRLPETYWCYSVPGPTPDPSPPRAATTANITFGCLNNFAKVLPPTLDLWAEILQRMPHSRLIIHSRPGSHLNAVRARFAAQNISPDRLEFLSRQPWPQYASTYGRIDIALDPFPWAGGITTCDALWMGVPVVTLAGHTAVGRGGASILSNVGLPKLIAQTPQQYLQIATELASDLPRLTELRQTLRPRMQASPLMDAPRFARNIEAAYRQMWRNWCSRMTA
jgi:protein O-GlcNAc transferase